MKKLTFLLLCISVSGFSQKSPQSVVEDFFVAFHSKDTVALQKVCYKDIVMQTVNNTKEISRLKTDKAEDFYKSIASIPNNFSFEERILDYKIQIDGNMAHVWTPYKFYINEKLSHFGVNSFTMIKESNNDWKIVHLIDTRRND